MAALVSLIRLLLAWADIAAFVRAFGDPYLALMALIAICVTEVLVVAMVIWQSVHLRRLRLEEEKTLLLQTGRPVRRTRRFLGRVIWEYEQTMGEVDRPAERLPKDAPTLTQDSSAASTDAGG